MRVSRPLQWDVSGSHAIATTPVGLFYEVIVFASDFWERPARLSIRRIGHEDGISFHADMASAQIAAADEHERLVREVLVDEILEPAAA